jgi:Protein of unknown function (DUF3300)
MIKKNIRKSLAVALSLVLIAATSPVVYGYQNEPPAGGAPPQGANGAPPESTTEAAPKSAAELQALVAPIALYPDALVAQVLSASTFPDQVALAQGWVQSHPGLTGSKLTTEVDKETWDPAVKALTAFPTVLDNMAKNLAWTSNLGEAYHFQAKDVMEAVQALREKAKAAGNLKTSSQITVVQQSPSTIVIQPANPQIIYVPQYNPTVIYGTPYVIPGYTPGEVAVATALTFGAGIAIGAMMSSSWGWSAWNVNWHGGVVAYGGHPYYGSAAWHGAYGAYGYHGYGAYGSGAAYHGAYGSAGAYHGYSANGNYHTGGAYNTAYGAGSQHTTYGADGAVHTGGSGYNKTTGQAYHAGGTQTAAGGTAYHGTTSNGQHYAGGTTASGQHYGGSTGGGWGHDDGASTRAASERGHASMGGFHGGGFRR